MGKTKIEWATHTVNWLAGCTKVSPACTHCYAEVMSARLATMPQAPPRYHDGVIADRRWTGRVSYDAAALVAAFPLLRRRGVRVFANSMSDTFHEHAPSVSLTDLADAIKSMPAGTPGVLMLLTKRPDRLLAWQREHFPGGLPAYVWVGCTVEDQRRANERAPLLLQVRASVRFLSCEPLLGPIDLDFLASEGLGIPGYRFSALQPWPPGGEPGISWVIAGGESGPGARPSQPDWFRSLRDQCERAGVPFFFKQWGSWVPQGRVINRDGSPATREAEKLHAGSWYLPDGTVLSHASKKSAGRLLDGREHNGMPEVTRV
jgi:protein gp37